MSGTAGVVGIAVIVGVVVTVQSQMLGALEGRVGSVATAGITLVTGGVAGLVFLAVLRPSFSNWRDAPWWVWLAGIVGLVVVIGVSYVVPRIGITASLTTVIAVQLIVATILEQTGWLEATARPLDLARIIGLILVSTGAWLVVR